MSISTNASPSKNGFNFQDVVATSLLIKNIKELDYIIDEGKKDVELVYPNGDMTYIQCKCHSNPIDNNYSTFLREALRDLINSFNNDHTPKKIYYITNANYPFGKKVKDFDFRSAYKKYNYTDFNKQVKGIIDTQIKKINDKYNNAPKESLYGFIHNSSDKAINNILKKLSVIKFAFDGSDVESKLQLAYSYTDEFLINIGLNGKLEKKNVFNNLYCRINIKSGEKNKKIKKENFISEIFISYLEINDSYDKFAKCFNLNFLVDDNEIKTKARNLENMYMNDFTIQQKLMKKLTDYISEYNKSTNDERYTPLVDFINDKISELSDLFSITDKSNINVVKYLVWKMILNNSKLEKIKEACNYDD